MKRIIRMVLIVLTIILILNCVFPKSSYCLDGGALLNPIMKLFTVIADGTIDILQSSILGQEGSSFWEVDRVGNVISIILGILAGALVLVGSVALAIFFAVPTGGASVGVLIAVGTKAAIMAIGKVVITYFVVSTIASNMLPDTFTLPFIAISPEEILQNRIEIFDVNYFNIPQNVSDTGNSRILLKKTIAKWYYSLRNIAVVCLMIVLVYIGIKILVSSVADEKAKYKRMLGDWFVSMCLLFVVHYIMIFSMNIVDDVNEMIGNTLNKNGVEYIDIVDDKVYDFVEKNLDQMQNEENNNLDGIENTETANIGENSVEYSTLYINSEGKKTVRFPVDNFLAQARIKLQILDENGNQKYTQIGYMIVYVMLTIFTVIFCYIYLKRLVYIGFLILVSPFVVLTYSIDRLKDGQAQGFNTWFREYLFNLAIQPLHLILYTVFVGAAMSMASSNPVYVLVILGFILPAEKILRKLFGFEKASTPGVLSGAIGTSLAMAGIQKFFGRKPHEKIENREKIGENYNKKEDVSIKEQDANLMLGVNKDMFADDDQNDKFQVPTSESYSNNEATFNARKIEENDSIYSGKTNEQNQMSSTQTSKAQARNVQIQDAQTQNNQNMRVPNSNIKTSLRRLKDGQQNKNKAKFNIVRAAKGATRHYVQVEGQRWANKVKNTSLTREAGKIILGGSAAAVAGTAGILLGAVEGSGEKAARNAGALGAVAFKGTTSRIDSKKVDGLKDSFIKAGYGDDYSQVKKDIAVRKIKNNLENRTKLENEMGWDKKKIDEFYKDDVNAYVGSGITDFDEMVIAEKMKKDGVVSDTQQAISTIYFGNAIGTDTRKLTDKKRNEWSYTIASRTEKFNKISQQQKKIQEKYQEEINDIRNQKLNKEVEKEKIEEVKQRRNNDIHFQNVTQRMQNMQESVLTKLDAYNKYKFK